MRRRWALAATLATGAAAVIVGVSAAGGPACEVRGQLPDPGCTPGSTFPAATAEDVCTRGWARDHRDVSESVRRQVLARYGGKPGEPYELDHLIPLELGGSNDPANLWPQTGRIPNPKDRVENRLHHLVCTGHMDLIQAQREIAKDWTAIPGDYR
jgi:hypothetical protein